MDINHIMKLLPHRYPFLLIDRIIECNPDESAHAIKCVTINEQFFQGHFPDRPIMPGVLIVEALAQTAAVAVAKSRESNLENLSVFFMTIDKCKFRKPVTPGDVLNLYIKKTNKVKNVYKFEGKCLVDGVIFAQCNFTAMMQDASINS
ncbi:MAG: 3-hydroxyacyl-ACP dehydratase FabZ [Alphaproteobacteria bacterium]|jgi:3-hydroxyacyl-[acyl-carrier-protein] dehydratase|tara:strand:- start:322 stop:765 length:444 start_codon:yes stop_codon:yes gene_type:complete